jgi:hypothetical protein
MLLRGWHRRVCLGVTTATVRKAAMRIQVTLLLLLLLLMVM